MIATRQDACEYCLAAVLVTETALDVLDDEGVRPEHHWHPGLTAVHRAMLALRDDDESVNRISLTARLQVDAAAGRGPFTDQGAAAALVQRLDGPVPALGELRSYARIVRREAEWDRRGILLDQAGRAIHSRDTDAFTAAIAAIDQADTATDPALGPDELLDEFAGWYQATDTRGIPLPFDTLTHCLRGGFKPGDTSIVAGWPAMGKSVLVGQIVHHANTEVGATCHEYVNEMSSVDRTCRMLARVTGIPFDRIITRRCSLEEVGRLLKAGQRLPAGMTNCAGWSADDIARQIRRHKHDLAVVDLVTRIPARDTADWDRVSGVLTDAARQSGTHVILVSQLNLERCKTAIRPSPTGRDLRNTGAWYQDARNVMFVHRDQELLEGMAPGQEVAQVLDVGHIRIEKASNGQPGIQPVTFDPLRMSFEERQMGALRAVA